MKIVFYFSVLTLYLFSCTIRFDRVPENEMTEFPKELSGKYFFRNTKDKDSTYLEITSKTILFSENKSLRGGGLSDTIKLAKGKKYYYLCFGDSLKHRFVWDVYPFTVSGKKLYLYALDADYYKKAIKRSFTPIDGFENLYMMNDEKLDRFCSKKLKTKNALKLVRVE